MLKYACMVGLLKWLLQTEISGLKFADDQKALKPVLRKLIQYFLPISHSYTNYRQVQERLKWKKRGYKKEFNNNQQ